MVTDELARSVLQSMKWQLIDIGLAQCIMWQSIAHASGVYHHPNQLH